MFPQERKEPAMAAAKDQDDRLFREAVNGLERGDFSRLEPLFDVFPSLDHQCRIVAWYEQGYFDSEPKAFDEAFTAPVFLVEPASPTFS
jgi:hypothetical protein